MESFSRLVLLQSDLRFKRKLRIRPLDIKEGEKVNVSDIKNIESEAGVIASIIKHPEFTFYSEQLRYNYFTDIVNGYIYWAVQQLARKEVVTIDAYNIMNILSSNKYTSERTEKEISIEILNDIITNSDYIARSTAEEYMVLVKNVVDAALRRSTYIKLAECERLCFNSSEKDLEQKLQS